MQAPDFQSEKNLIRDYYADLDGAAPNQIAQVECRYASSFYCWRGFHPFGELSDPETVAEQFWVPLRHSLSGLQRRIDVFFAGVNEIDDHQSVWVVSMGHLLGLFDAAWLSVQPTGKMVMLRYCAFHRVVDGKVSEQMMYFDLPHLMAQAGQSPFPTQTAVHLVQPGPMTHDGLLYGPQDPADGQKTQDVINQMVTDLGQWNLGLPLEKELARTWHDGMLWWGPEGIGSTFSIERYAMQHSGPFRAAFSNRSKTRHIARVAEGYYGGFVGWPNFTATLSGPFMGVAPTGKSGAFRVIDIYRRQGEKLIENWIFIDLLHFWMTQGIDVLKDGLPIQADPEKS